MIGEEGPLILAVSRPGRSVAERIGRALGVGCDVQGDRQDLLANAFAQGRPVVAVGALGLWVRILAPHLSDKRRDPPVVVVDDGGRFAIAAIGAHCGGNELARVVAEAIDACPVVTTSAEVLGVPSPEVLARSQGWAIEASREALLRVSAALVNGEPVQVYQDRGDRAWQDTLPPGTRIADRLESLPNDRPALLITDLELPDDERRMAAWVALRPRTLVAGLGASSGAPADEIEALLRSALREGGIATASLLAFATIDRKADEPGIRDVAARLAVSVRPFPASELSRVSVPNPSQDVARHVETPSVCEAAALLASGADSLLVPKRKSEHATVAIARRAEAVV